jgi:AbrB family looped-hinge helix DNA binding protein
MDRATITSKGQMTIPKSVRDALGLRPGDRVVLVPQPNGTALMMPTVKLEELAGMLPKPKRPVTVEQMNKAIVEHASRHARR